MTHLNCTREHPCSRLCVSNPFRDCRAFQLSYRRARRAPQSRFEPVLCIVRANFPVCACVSNPFRDCTAFLRKEGEQGCSPVQRFKLFQGLLCILPASSPLLTDSCSLMTAYCPLTLSGLAVHFYAENPKQRELAKQVSNPSRACAAFLRFRLKRCILTRGSKFFEASLLFARGDTVL
jgi:hypothetical protein